MRPGDAHFASSLSSSGTPNTLTVFGVEVQVNAATQFLGTTNSLSDIAPGDVTQDFTLLQLP